MSGLPELPLEQPVSGTCIEAEPFALQVLDDLMAPEFPSGCIIIVDPTGLARDGAFVVAEVAGEVLLRRLSGSAQEGFMLRAEAGGVAPTRLAEGLGAVRGVVTQRAGRRRSQHKHYD